MEFRMKNCGYLAMDTNLHFLFDFESKIKIQFLILHSAFLISFRLIHRKRSPFPSRGRLLDRLAKEIVRKQPTKRGLHDGGGALSARPGIE